MVSGLTSPLAALHTNLSSEAGPSTPTPRRIATANFHSDSDDDEPSLPTSPIPNGGPSVKKRKLGHGKASRVNGHHGTDGAALRKKAEELFTVRQSLPFYQGRRAILDEIIAHDTTIIIGETGCGKSTQLPHLLRRHGLSVDHFGRPPRIAVTQPRRLPAIALAQRVSAEMGVALGEEVGYTVRFEDVTSPRTGVRYLTEGVLMRELASSSKESKGELDLLLRYDIIIIDEAHERTLNTDFLCGALKKIQARRKELSLNALPNGSANGQKANGSAKGKEKEIRPLKIVVMSATLDPSKFTNFFETARDALIVKGRMYPVATQHSVQPVDDFVEAAARQVLGIHCSPDAKGDVLVFMPGSEEIENCVEVLRRAAKDLPEEHMKMQVLPLYAALPPAAQAKIFATPPANTRRVIVATNIAETSITIPGVAYVVDSGFKKEKEYIFRTSGAIEHLKRKDISKAAAWQRTGRAGREREGYCFRLFTKDAFEKLIEYDAPEIQRCNLAAAVLQLVAMGQDPFTFPYIDNPGVEPIRAAFSTLSGLGALSGPTTITPLGLAMLSYPLDPTHSRILLASFDLGCPSEIIDILSCVVAGPIWIDRSSERDSTAAARAKYIHRDGDHLTNMNLFRAFQQAKTAGQEGVGRWCRDNHVNSKTLAHALRIQEQLIELAEKEGRDPAVSCGSEYDKVGKALLSGLFMNSAIITPDGKYRQTAGVLQIKIHPSSVLMSKKVPAILYDELAITKQIYARNVSAFDQAWLLDIPWFKQAGQAVPSAARVNGNL